jgi:nickel/cobalt exporter
VVGAAAAIGMRQATERWSWFGGFVRRAPYVSSLIIICIGAYVGFEGWKGLAG